MYCTPFSICCYCVCALLAVASTALPAMAQSSSIVEVYAGAGAGLVGTIIGYPLDVIKGQLQTRQNSSMIQVMKEISKSQGVNGFYKGVIPPLISLTFLNMTNFSNYAMTTRKLNIDFAVNAETFEPKVFIAGGAVGPIAALISTPFEFLKIQMQFSARNGVHYKSTLDAIVSISSIYGPNTFFRGHLINTYREILFLGTYFMCYEHIKKYIQTVMPLHLAIPLSGGLAGGIGWFVSFPLDCIKTNIQNIYLPTNSAKVNVAHTSIVTATRKLIKEKGVMNMYKGVTPSILRAFVVSSTRFSAYESIVSFFSPQI